MASFGKSWRAVSGHFWQAFGTYVLVFLIWVAFDIALGLALVAVPGALRSCFSTPRKWTAASMSAGPSAPDVATTPSMYS